MYVQENYGKWWRYKIITCVQVKYFNSIEIKKSNKVYTGEDTGSCLNKTDKVTVDSGVFVTTVSEPVNSLGWYELEGNIKSNDKWENIQTY